MAGQTKMNPSQTEDPSGQGSHRQSRRMAGNVAGVIHDVTELIELQARLFAADIKAAVRESILPLVLMVTAVCILLGAMPVLLLGVAEVLAAQVEWSRTVSLLVAAGMGVGVALLVLVIAWWRLRRGISHLDGSLEELERNVAWIKQVLKNEGPATAWVAYG